MKMNTYIAVYVYTYIYIIASACDRLLSWLPPIYIYNVDE